MTISTIFPYLVALGLTASVGIIGLIVYLVWRTSHNDEEYDSQLAELLSDDVESELGNSSTNVTYWSRWCDYWSQTLRGAGVDRYSVDATTAGRDVAVLLVAVGVIVGVVANSMILGAIATGVAGTGLSMLMRYRYNNKNEDLNLQIPGFLYSLKANIQAADTNERALLKIIPSIPSPLYDDLKVAESVLQSGDTFKEAMETMSAKTTSRDLQFLCACMIQASASGSSMVTQIDSIQRVLESRRKVSDEINRSVKAVQPAIWLASVIIPALFLGSYFSDSAAQGFWFVTPMSWAALALTAILYAIGLVMTKRQVDKIRNM